MNIWVIMLLVMALSFIIQQVLTSRFKKYSQVPSPGGLTGADVAKITDAVHSMRRKCDEEGRKTLSTILYFFENYLGVIKTIDVYTVPVGTDGTSRVGLTLTKLDLTFDDKDIQIEGVTEVIDVPWILIWGLIFAVLSILSIQFLMKSTLGKGISAVKYDEISAEIMSVDTNNMKLIAFTFSSFLAGIAGGLFAHMLGFINPSSFGILVRLPLELE